MIVLAAAWWVWHVHAHLIGTTTTDEHNQTLIALAGLALVILGGLIHTVFRLGTLTEQVKGLRNDVDDLRKTVWRRR